MTSDATSVRATSAVSPASQESSAARLGERLVGEFEREVAGLDRGSRAVLQRDRREQRLAWPEDAVADGGEGEDRLAGRWRSGWVTASWQPSPAATARPALQRRRGRR